MCSQENNPRMTFDLMYPALYIILHIYPIQISVWKVWYLKVGMFR